jgi:hypothetical protein
MASLTYVIFSKQKEATDWGQAVAQDRHLNDHVALSNNN